MREPIISTEPLTGLELMLGDERPAVPIFAAHQPAQWTLALVDENKAARTLDVSLLHPPALMLLPESILPGLIAIEPRSHGVNPRGDAASTRQTTARSRCSSL